jgi:hypothetical protein
LFKEKRMSECEHTIIEALNMEKSEKEKSLNFSGKFQEKSELWFVGKKK